MAKKFDTPTRAHTPVEVETAVLTKSRRVCCLCFALYQDPSPKAGQIAHIDRNAANPKETNLAWLCLSHHNEYDGNWRQSKNVTPGELRSYRDMLHKAVEEGRAPGPYTGAGPVLELTVGDGQLWPLLASNDRSSRPVKHVFLIPIEVCNTGMAPTGLRSARLLQSGSELARLSLHYCSRRVVDLKSGTTQLVPIMGTQFLYCGQDQLIGPGEVARFTAAFETPPVLAIPDTLPPCLIPLDVPTPLQVELIPVKGMPVSAELAALQVRG